MIADDMSYYYNLDGVDVGEHPYHQCQIQPSIKSRMPDSTLICIIYIKLLGGLYMYSLIIE